MQTPDHIESVYIELTNFCNHHCTFCPSDDLKRPRGRMEPALFESITNQLAEHKLATTIAFHLMGEPFIHKNILDFLAHAEKVGLKVVLTTNGSLLTPEKAAQVFDHLYGSLILSMQTPNAATYAERGVKNQSFERYRDQIRSVVRAYMARNRCRENATTARNYVEIHFLNTKYGRPGRDVVDSEEMARAVLQEWWDFVHEVAAELEIDLGDHHMPPLEGLLEGSFHGYWLEVVPGVVVRFKVSGTFANSRIDSGATVVPTKVGTCRNPFTQLGILWNGCATLCCVDYDGEIFIGNANETPVKEIWYGDKAESIRQGFRENKVLHPFCQYCLGAVVPAGQPAPITLEDHEPATSRISSGYLLREAIRNYRAGGVGTLARHSLGFAAKRLPGVKRDDSN